VKYGVLMLAAAALSSSQASAGELQSVYVAPGGVYIAAARVFVAPGAGAAEPPYAAPGAAYGAPGYGPPGPAYGAPGYAPLSPAHGTPAYYRGPGAYSAPPAYIEPEPVYRSAYAAEYAPRPPAAIPYSGYNGGGRCVVNLGYGRWAYCR
jgi:hypothetical protein